MISKFTVKHFVEYISPGTLFAETSSRPSSAWCTAAGELRKPAAVAAIQGMSAIIERYNARPYGFRFRSSLTHPELKDADGNCLTVNSKMIKESGTVYINARILTIEDVKARNKNGQDDILISNMDCNCYPAVVETTSSYRNVTELRENDVLVDRDGNITARGNDHRWTQLRSKLQAEQREKYKIPHAGAY